MYTVAFLTINSCSYTSNSGVLPKHYLNKVVSYERKQIDIYFENPDYDSKLDEPEFNTLSVEFTQFNGLFTTEDPIRIFKKSLEFLLLNARKHLKSNYTNDSVKYSIRWDDIQDNNIGGMFVDWMNLVTKKTVFSLSELDLLRDYQRSFYSAMKLFPELLNGGLWGNMLACFETEENLLKFCQSKHKIKNLPPVNKYK